MHMINPLTVYVFFLDIPRRKYFSEIYFKVDFGTGVYLYGSKIYIIVNLKYLGKNTRRTYSNAPVDE